MNKPFDLKKAAWEAGKLKAGDELVLDPIEPTEDFENDLAQAILRVLKQGQSETADKIAKAAKADKVDLWFDVGSARHRRRSKSLLAVAIDALRRIFGLLSKAAEKMIERAVRLEEERHRQDLVAVVRKKVGVDLDRTVKAPDVEPHIRAAVRQNVSLVRGLTEAVAARLENTLLFHITQGATARQIEKTIVEGFGFGRERAKLIARDQASKFNGALNRVRQEQLGVDEYEWSSAGDERVRASHQARDGKIFKWSSPPPDGHPGQPINCRCVARAVLA